jgi:hypothetical protein
MTGFIKCPTRKAEIPLTEVIDHEIHEQLETRLAAEVAARDGAYEAALARKSFEAEREKRDEAIRLRPEERVGTELADLRAPLLTERDVLLKQ